MTGGESRRCKATARSTGERCRKLPVLGQKVCSDHGGSSPQARSAAARRLVEQKAAEVCKRLWPDQEIENPLEELMRLAGEAVAMKNHLRAQVDALNDQLTYWTDRQWRDTDGKPIRTESVEHVRAIVEAYERALDRAAKILTALARLGIEERLARVRETEANLVVQALDDALGPLKLDQRTRRQVNARLADNLVRLDDHRPQAKRS